MTIRLLQTHTLTFTRTLNTITQPYVGRDGIAVHPTETEEVVALGSLQPYMKFSHRIPLEEGMREENTYIFLTKTKIQGLSQSNNTLPDVTTIEGEQYKVVKVADWTGYGLRTDHYQVVLYLTSPS